MASAEVMQGSAVPPSRKQGHLEAGKKRLEEFRKKKAEGKAKKAASADQLLVPEVNHNEKFPQDREHVSERATSQGDNVVAIDLSRSDTVYENSTVASSRSTEADLSRVMETTSVDNDSKSHTDHLSSKFSQDEGTKLYNNSRFPWSMDGHYPQGREENDLSIDSEHREELPDEPAKAQQDAPYPFYPKSTFDVKSKYSSSYSIYAQLEDKKSSVDQYIENQNKSETLQSNTFYSPGNPRSGFKQMRGLFSSSLSDGNNYTISEDTAGVEQHRPESMEHDGSMGLNIGAKKVYESSGHHLDIDNEPSHSSQSSSVNSSSTFRSSTSLQNFSSTISGPGNWRTRPSFLGVVNVPRPSSVSHLSFSESANADPPVSLNNSKIDTAEVQPLSSQKSEDDDFRKSAALINPGSFGGKGSSLNFSASLSNGQQLREEVTGGAGKNTQNFSGPVKDEDFAALEQHIEDLTQEKFSLQRAVESSRTLAESLAAENSSLTESFNQQGKVVNQLKSDMAQLHEEIRAQLIALEAMKAEYANAQLECSAADERAKILASEVIGLEEKALRLRSNELKLEKQLEKSHAEINSYKKKVSSLEKERQDFQSTIEALQEERKLLQSKVRKVSSNAKVIDLGKASPVKKDAFTSTEDLDIELSNLVGGENATEMTSTATANAEQESNAPALSSGNVSMSNFQTEARSFVIPDASGVIPNDQLRMIDNINSLISELTLEKEELMQALEVQSTSNSKLMDMNKELSQKLEMQTQRLELLTAQHIAGENIQARSMHAQSIQDTAAYTDEGDEVVERVLSWIMKLFPGGPTRRRTSKLL